MKSDGENDYLYTVDNTAKVKLFNIKNLPNVLYEFEFFIKFYH